MDNKWLCVTDCFIYFMLARTHGVCGVAEFFLAVWSLVARVLDLGIPGEAPRDHASASQRAAGEKGSVASGRAYLLIADKWDAETDDA